MLRLVDFGFALDEIERGTLKGLALFAPEERDDGVGKRINIGKAFPKGKYR